MNKTKHMCLSIFIWIASLLLLMNPIMALEEKGSISIALPDTESQVSKENVKFGVIQVAKLDNGSFVMMEAFKDSGVDLNTIETTVQLDEAASKLTTVVNDLSHLEMTTNQEGCCQVSGLEVGVYLVYPIDLAQYEHVTSVLVAIPSYLDEKQQMQYDLQLIPKHMPVLSGVEVKKVDAKDEKKTLSQATFTLYEDKDCLKEMVSLQTDKDGIARFVDLKRGTYYLKETKAPQGYQLSQEVIEILLDENYDETKSYQVEVKNQPNEIVQTGDRFDFDFYVYLIIISSVNGVFLYYSMNRKDKKKDK